VRDDHPLPGTDHLIDGVRVHVVHHGDGTGVPVVLLHGIPTSSYLWRDVQRDLGRRHRTLAPDLLGLGCSERRADARYDLGSQAQLVRQLLDDCGVDKVALVGHDLGGAVAIHLAAVAPERVAALVLIDAPVHADVWPVPQISALATPLLGEAQLGALRTSSALATRYVRMQISRGLRASTLSDRSAGQYAAPVMTSEGSAGLLRLLRALDPAAVESAFDVVRRTAPPTLVLWADEDVWHGPAYGRRVAGDIDGARFVSVAEAGHFLPEDRPERVAEEIEGFLADV
jgi:pimeloyl-ACP methyl ester carboxylesterase